MDLAEENDASPVRRALRSPHSRPPIEALPRVTQNIHRTKHLGGKRLSPRRAAGPRSRSDAAGVQGAAAPAYFPRSDHPHRPGFHESSQRLVFGRKIGRGRPSRASVRPLHPQSLGGHTLTAQVPAHCPVPGGNEYGTALERFWNGFSTAAIGTLPCRLSRSFHDTTSFASGSGETLSNRVAATFRGRNSVGFRGEVSPSDSETYRDAVPQGSKPSAATRVVAAWEALGSPSETPPQRRLTTRPDTLLESLRKRAVPVCFRHRSPLIS